jgi:hypothetical protein
VFEPHHLAHLIQQFQFGVRGDQVRANAVASLPGRICWLSVNR